MVSVNTRFPIIMGLILLLIIVASGMVVLSKGLTGSCEAQDINLSEVADGKVRVHWTTSRACLGSVWIEDSKDVQSALENSFRCTLPLTIAGSVRESFDNAGCQYTIVGGSAVFELDGELYRFCIDTESDSDEGKITCLIQQEQTLTKNHRLTISVLRNTAQYALYETASDDKEKSVLRIEPVAE